MMTPSERFGADGVKTFGQLRERVRRLAASLAGLKEGDRVGGYIPHCPEAIEAMAATASLWASSRPFSTLKLRDTTALPSDLRREQAG